MTDPNLSHSIPLYYHPIPIPHTVFPFQEKEQKYSLRLEDMRVRDVESSRFSIGKKHIFALYYTTGK